MATVGIDLGTSNSLVTYWDGEQVKGIPNRFGELLTPSAVGLDDNDEILIGAIAKERLLTHPQLTAATFKRFMGTDKVYELGQQTFTSTELSALVLKSLKEDAEVALSEPCDEAVISVPAYFNNIQREATLEAANLAGLKVLNLISEPTAAALAYGIHEEQDLKVLVLDLGGGTFDVSLLEMFEGVMQVEAIAGDNQLGGEDFTRLISLDFFEKNEMASEQISAPLEALVYKKAEDLKRSFSHQIAGKFDLDWENQTYSYQLTRTDYERLCQTLLQRLRAPIVRVLKDTGCAIHTIDRVILIGGATKDPLIRNFFAKLLKAIPYTKINPDEAVGLGAGLQGVLKTERKMIAEMMLTDVCAHSMGVDVTRTLEDSYVHGIFAPIIERNTTIPVSREELFQTIHDGQTELCFNIYQGESPYVKDNIKIGELTIPIKPAPRGYPVACRFTYDTNGLLEVILTVLETKETHQLIIEQAPGKLSPEQIEASLKKFDELKVHPRDRAENRLIRARLERLYAEAIGDKRHYIQKLILDFEQVLGRQNERLTQAKVRELKQLIYQLETDNYL